MIPDLRKVLLFVALFLPLLAASLWVYTKALPLYVPLVTGSSNLITERLQPPLRLELQPDGRLQYFEIRARGWKNPQHRWPASTTHFLYLGLGLYPALILATPLPWKRRLRLMMIGLAMLFAVQLLASIGLVRATHCLRLVPGTRSCLWLLRFVFTSGQLAAAVVWAMLTWRDWTGGRTLRGGPGKSGAVA